MQIRYWKLRGRAATLTVAMALLAMSVPAVPQEKPYPEIDPQLKMLKDQFNADAGKVRVLVIGDPTCPPCRHGASTIQESVVQKFATDKLAVYVVWVPLLNLQDPATLQRHAHQYANLIPSGSRVATYSDPQAYVAKAYGPVIGVPYSSPAWDVYFAFGVDLRWGDTPPTPSYWEHQLGGMPTEKLLDGPRFGGEIGKLLSRAGN